MTAREMTFIRHCFLLRAAV